MTLDILADTREAETREGRGQCGCGPCTRRCWTPRDWWRCGGKPCSPRKCCRGRPPATVPTGGAMRVRESGRREATRATQGGDRSMSGTIFTPGPTPNTVRAADGTVKTAPDAWVLLQPGDAALTRRVKAAGDHWVVQEKKGRKVFSRGTWAAAATIDRIRAELEVERSTEGFAKKKEADARRREKAQAEYVEDFHGA